MPTKTNLTQEFELATKLAYQAGDIALKHQANLQNLEVSRKSQDNSPVSAADLEISDYLTTNLQQAFPEDIIISEESKKLESLFEQHKNSKHANQKTWFIDPIDGTKDFIKGQKDFSIMIGLCINNKPELGVVYQPRNNSLWRGLVSLNLCEEIYKNKQNNFQTKKLECSQRPCEAFNYNLILSHRAPKEFADKFTQKLKAKNYISKSSVGLKLAAICRGDADLYITNTKHIKLWDTCGPNAILTAAGGICSNVYGEPLNYNQELAHNTEILATTTSCENLIRPILNNYI